MPDIELSRKLIDALIRTVIEQGFAPGLDAITGRAGVSKMSGVLPIGLPVGSLPSVLMRFSPETFTPSRGLSRGQVFLKPAHGFRFPGRLVALPIIFEGLRPARQRFVPNR